MRLRIADRATQCLSRSTPRDPFFQFAYPLAFRTYRYYLSPSPVFFPFFPSFLFFPPSFLLSCLPLFVSLFCFFVFCHLCFFILLSFVSLLVFGLLVSFCFPGVLSRRVRMFVLFFIFLIYAPRVACEPAMCEKLGNLLRVSFRALSLSCLDSTFFSLFPL